jgi:hypothetical protein
MSTPMIAKGSTPSAEKTENLPSTFSGISKFYILCLFAQLVSCALCFTTMTQFDLSIFTKA